MPKRSRKAQAFSRRVKRKITKSLKKRKFIPTATPPRNVRQRYMATPPSTGSGRRLYRAASNAASYGANLFGGTAAGVAVSGASAAGEYLYDRFNTSGSGNSKTSSFNQSGVLAGKYYGKGKKINRSKFGKKGLSKFGMAQKGITYREEYRIQDPITAADNANLEQFNESRLIGHTSLPARATLYNIFRALLKFLFTKAGAHIDALTSNTGNNVSSAVLRLRFYPTWQSTTLTTYVYTCPSSGTWVALMDGFVDGMMLSLDPTLAIADVKQVRWVELEYEPATSYARDDYNRVRVSLNYLTFDIRSKSMLKIQNQSGVYTSTTTDASAPDMDQVTAVPIEAHLYYVKGNQFVHQNRRKSATVGLGFLGFDERYLANTAGSEPCPAHEIVNCTGKDKFVMDPGHIKTSIISHSKRYKFGQLMSMFLSRRVSIVTASGDTWIFEFVDGLFVKDLGHSRAIHLDKVIGQLSNVTNLSKVRIMAEVELEQQIACFGPMNTSTDQYEVQRPTV